MGNRSKNRQTNTKKFTVGIGDGITMQRHLKRAYGFLVLNLAILRKRRAICYKRKVHIGHHIFKTVLYGGMGEIK